jgi:nucleoid DNA-binding protein
MAKKSGSKPMTKTEIMRSISETTNLPKKDVVAVLESLTTEIQKALKGSGIGVFSIPGLVKIERRKVPARPAQKGVKNPFTGELQDRPAKPASVKVRVRALKNLKAMVSGGFQSVHHHTNLFIPAGGIIPDAARFFYAAWAFHAAWSLGQTRQAGQEDFRSARHERLGKRGGLCR